MQSHIRKCKTSHVDNISLKLILLNVQKQSQPWHDISTVDGFILPFKRGLLSFVAVKVLRAMM